MKKLSLSLGLLVLILIGIRSEIAQDLLKACRDGSRSSTTPVTQSPSIGCESSCLLTQGQSFSFPLRITPSNSTVTVFGLLSGWVVDSNHICLTGSAESVGDTSILIVATNGAGVQSRTVAFRTLPPGSTQARGETPASTPTREIETEQFLIKRSPLSTLSDSTRSKGDSPSEASRVVSSRAVTSGASPGGADGESAGSVSSTSADHASATLSTNRPTVQAKPKLRIEIVTAGSFGVGEMARRLTADFSSHLTGELQRSDRFDILSPDLIRGRTRAADSDFVLAVQVTRYSLSADLRNRFLVINGRYKYVPKITYACNWTLTAGGIVRASDRVEGSVTGAEFVVRVESAGRRGTQPPSEQQAVNYALQHGDWPSGESMSEMCSRMGSQILSGLVLRTGSAEVTTSR